MVSPPTRPALRARYDRRREDLVQAAARVFAQRGYHGTSIDDLMRETGMTRGGLYHYTTSKQELLLSIVEDLMVPLLRRAEEIVAGERDAEARLRSLLAVWL